MAEDQTDPDPRSHDSEMALARLKQRYQLISTVLGTSLVSVVGAWLVFAEKTQKNEQDFDTGHRDFVAKFVEIALDEDIERRQRLARYFATVTLDRTQRDLWQDYADYVDGLIEENPAKIAALKAESAAAAPADRAVIDSRIELLERQLGASRADRRTPESDQCIAGSSSFPARWLCIAQGEAALGVAEVPGSGSNQRILDYARYAAVDNFYTGDEIPWAGLFLAWVIAQSGVPEEELPAHPLLARAWLEFGEELTEPVPGAIVVVQPASSAATSGHVGFYVGEEEDKIVLIAGNVQNSVRTHRIDRSRVLGYRGYGG